MSALETLAGLIKTAGVRRSFSSCSGGDWCLTRALIMTSSDMAMNAIEPAVFVTGRESGFIGRHRTGLTWLAAVIWLAVIGFCLALIQQYTAIPGDAGAPPAQWPVASRIMPDPKLPTLLLFAHPQCPCTRATMGELDLLLARVQGRVNVQVWFLKPDNTAQSWTNTDLWSSAAAIPGVTVHEDRSGREASLFHAETSGQTLLYHPDGHLLFQGGITIARGHAGDNPGRSALNDLITGLLTNPMHQIITPVYGCSLFARQCQSGGATKP